MIGWLFIVQLYTASEQKGYIVAIKKSTQKQIHSTEEIQWYAQNCFLRSQIMNLIMSIKLPQKKMLWILLWDLVHDLSYADYVVIINNCCTLFSLIKKNKQLHHECMIHPSSCVEVLCKIINGFWESFKQ